MYVMYIMYVSCMCVGIILNQLEVPYSEKYVQLYCEELSMDENEYDEKAIKKSIKRLLDENAFIEKDLVYKYIYIALAHRCMRIIGTFTNYFKNKKLLNRKQDLEKFLQRLGFSLDKLNYRKEKKLLEKLL